MRTLVDLLNKVAIITWNETFNFPNAVKDRYRDLYYDVIYNNSEDEGLKAEFESLKQIKGFGDIYVQTITIANVAPIKRNSIEVSQTMSGREWEMIQQAMEALRDGQKHKTSTLYDAVEIEMPF